MVLVLLGGEPLETLEQWVQELFLAVPSGRGPRPAFGHLGRPYTVRKCSCLMQPQDMVHAEVRVPCARLLCLPTLYADACWDVATSQSPTLSQDSKAEASSIRMSHCMPSISSRWGAVVLHCCMRIASCRVLCISGICGLSCKAFSRAFCLWCHCQMNTVSCDCQFLLRKAMPLCRAGECMWCRL